MRIGAYLDGFKVQRSEVHGCRTHPVSGRRPTLNREPLNISVADPGALQSCADRIDPRRIQERLDQAVNDRFADAQAENLNVQIDYPLLEKLAQPRRLRSQRMAGIRLENDRIIRLLEILMHSSAHFNGLSATDLHQAVLDAHHITASQYTRNQLAYDLRKLRAQYRRTTRSFNDLIALLKAA